MPGRWSGTEYRYGFQNQEQDGEIKGHGNSVNYRFRMHDPRLGRFFATDPLQMNYPGNSPYAFSENQVINAIELEGLEKFELSNGTTLNGPYSVEGAARTAQEQGTSLSGQNGFLLDEFKLEEDYPPLSQMTDLGIRNYFEGFNVVSINEDAKREQLQYDALTKITSPENIGFALGLGFGLNTAPSIGGKNFNPFHGLTGAKAVASFTDDALRFKKTHSISGNPSSRTVGEYVKQFKTGGPQVVDAVDVALINGEKYILNGHHRVEAALRTGSQVRYRVVNPSEFSSFGYKSADEIINANIFSGGNKLNGRLVNKIAGQ